MKRVYGSVICLVLFLGCSRFSSPQEEVSSVPRHASPAGARVFILEPAEGAVVKNPVTVRFGLEGMELAPAGDPKENTGHHHLLIDLDSLPPLDRPIPANDQSKHFGKAQTETTLTLSPGPHTLQLLLGDGSHIPHNPPVFSEKRTITVE